jgi:hypothetical protein
MLGLTTQWGPERKGKFGQKSAGGETGERHVPPAVQASIDEMGNDGRESNLAPLSLDSDRNTLLHSASVQTRDTWQECTSWPGNDHSS